MAHFLSYSGVEMGQFYMCGDTVLGKIWYFTLSEKQIFGLKEVSL